MVKNIDGECSPASSPVLAHPDPSSISTDAWRSLESATFSVMHKIQPTVSSEHLRARVIDYLQRLFRLRAGYQAFPFGSVPLKTYLPHGDIDLTLFGPALSDENLENEVCAILKSEEQWKHSEFEVKDVNYVPANKVKLVKCKVQNICVDISVNQIGGLCTLCFLEKVDQNFGKNHLFRRSVMLIKDWCYYESNILGAHNGLISYALEILVLYIIHIFHKSLDGPLAVLYRFLNYYSIFDWYNKGISLLGPVSLSSLPELFTEASDTRDDGFLAREKFLKECAEVFSVPLRNSEENPQVFSRKFLNIVDPLKQSNNLGRNVSKENFVRIRNEFYIGAHKLGKILPVPECFAVNEISRFFSKTLEMADVLRPDVLVSSSDDVVMTENVTNDSVSLGMDVAGVNKGSSPNSSCGLSNQFSYIKILDSNNDGSVKQKECNSVAEYKETKSASWALPDSDARSHATTTDSLSMRSGGDFSGASPSPSETCTLQSGRDHCAQHLLFQSENGKKVDVRDSTKYHKEFSGSSPPQLWHNNTCSSLTGLVDDRANSVLTPKTISQQGGATNNIVSDLAGGSGVNLLNLLYARGFQQDSPSSQLYNYPMLAKNGAAVPDPLYQTDDHMAMRAHGTGGTYFPESNLLVDRPHAVQVNTGANDHGTTALAAPASSSPSSAPRQPTPQQPASLAPPLSPSPPFAWPGGSAQHGGAHCRRHGLEGNAGGVTGAGSLVGVGGVDAGVGAAEGPAPPVAAVHSEARMRRPRTRGRR